MGQCLYCGKSLKLISQILSLCYQCLRCNFEQVYPQIKEVHKRCRQEFGLPTEVPRQAQGVKCTNCQNECQIPRGAQGYCGITQNQNGKLITHPGNLYWYYDSLPTNCVADWVCPGGTGSGYPEFSYRAGPEYGYKNLAVFYNTCSFNCLFCQNWSYRRATYQTKVITPYELARQVDQKTTCICYFGGDPTPQITHALESSHLALKNKKGILRICWETNGSMDPVYLEPMLELSLHSGGCIKFDLKAWHQEIHLALTGTSNQRTLANFKYLARKLNQRPKPPLLVASTLLVPGYVDQQEVKLLAQFIATCSPKIPYTLLAFHPQFYMSDLPTTSLEHAQRCLKIAQEAGLENVRVANIHLLSHAKYDEDFSMEI